MGIGGLVLGLAVAAALLALWCHVRWPDAAPANLLGAAVRVVVGFALLQAGVIVLERAVGASQDAALLAVVGVILPVLTFAFLTSLWVMKLFADTIKGHI